MAFGKQFERFGNVSADFRWEHHRIAIVSGQGIVPEDYRFVGIKLQSIADTEDKFSFPTEGVQLSLSYESALKGFGSEVSFSKIDMSYEAYASVLQCHTFRPKVTLGFADATLPLAEQYSLGGLNSLFGLREDDSRGRQIFRRVAENPQCRPASDAGRRSVCSAHRLCQSKEPPAPIPRQHGEGRIL